jgi:periplasmic protein TonB
MEHHLRKYRLLYLSLILCFTFSMSYCQEKSGSEVKDMAGKAPTPDVGMEKFVQWMKKNNRLWNSSDTLTHRHMVYVSFKVDEEGKLSDYEIIKGLGSPYDEEVLRLLRKSPFQWSPVNEELLSATATTVIPVRFSENK